MPTEDNDAIHIRTARTGRKSPASPGAPSEESGRRKFSDLLDGKPKSKSGQVRQLWPRIKVALREGHQLKQIWHCLVMDGLDLSYSKLRGHVSRLRKLEAEGADLPVGDKDREVTRAAGAQPRQNTNPGSFKRDPLANLRKSLNNRPGFQFDESPPDEKKLI